MPKTNLVWEEVMRALTTLTDAWFDEVRQRLHFLESNRADIEVSRKVWGTFLDGVVAQAAQARGNDAVSSPDVFFNKTLVFDGAIAPLANTLVTIATAGANKNKQSAGSAGSESTFTLARQDSNFD